MGGYSGSDSTGDKTQSTLGGSNVKDYWIVKIDSVGSKQWDKSYRAIETDYLYSMQQTSDGGYILGGISLSGISGDKTEPNWDTTGITYDFWVVKADSLGNKLWDRRYGGTKNDSLSYVQQTTDGGYILGGLSYSGISGDKTEPNWDTTGNTSDYWLVKIDSLGTVQWDKRYGGTGNDCRVGGARQTTDGGYLLCGVSSSPLSGDKTEANLGARQTWVVKTDSLGNKQWDKTIKTDGSDLWSYAIEIEHDCYVIANSTKATAAPDSYKSQPSWNNSYDYWFIKFCDMNGWHSVPDVLQDGVLSLYPNPVNTSLNILINSIKEEHAEIILQDVLGQKKFSKPMQLHTGKNNCTIDVSGFAKGIYFMQIKTKERGYVSKVVLE